jgi:Tol biopolymer transport system component
VESADWGPDGSTLLITHQVDGADRLEFPPGKLIYGNPGVIGHPRLSPRGDLIAFFEHPNWRGDDGSVVFVTLGGKRTVLSSGWNDLTGLAWSPSGDEIWFTGDRNNNAIGLFAVSLAGREREVEHIPGDLLLFDVTRDGRVLMGQEDWRGGMYGMGPGQTQERELSLFDFSITSDLSRDGKLVLFLELGEMGGAVSPSFLRSMDGGPAVRLSDSPCGALTHDAQRMVCSTPDGQLTEVPIKTGETRVLTHDKLQHGGPEWFSDEKRILFPGQEPGSGQRLYVQDTTGGEARAITPEGAGIFRLSPDETRVAVAMGTDSRIAIYPVSGTGNPQTIPGLEADEVPAAWSSDSRFLYCYRLGRVPASIFRVEVATGRRTEWKKLVPPDPIGVTLVAGILFSADMKSYAYSINRRLDNLYLVEGLK